MGFYERPLRWQDDLPWEVDIALGWEGVPDEALAAWLDHSWPPQPSDERDGCWIHEQHDGGPNLTAVIMPEMWFEWAPARRPTRCHASPWKDCLPWDVKSLIMPSGIEWDYQCGFVHIPAVILEARLQSALAQAPDLIQSASWVGTHGDPPAQQFLKFMRTARRLEDGGVKTWISDESVGGFVHPGSA
ncbi:MAG TPA: hypothetical protein DEV93_15985 [Chloroflexi bacterium]|nr:hypothetical protein [Chloroflexota bacterium]